MYMVKSGVLNGIEYDTFATTMSNRELMFSKDRFCLVDENLHKLSKSYIAIKVLERIAIGINKDEEEVISLMTGQRVFPDATSVVVDENEKIIRFCIDGLWGIASMSGVILAKPRWDFVEKFQNGIARVCKDGAWNIINKRGQTLLRWRYHYIGEISDKDHIVVGWVRKYGVIDINENVVIPIKYSHISADDKQGTTLHNGSSYDVDVCVVKKNKG